MQEKVDAIDVKVGQTIFLIGRPYQVISKRVPHHGLADYVSFDLLDKLKGAEVFDARFGWYQKFTTKDKSTK